MTETRPRALLRWAGSKRQIFPSIKAFWSSEYRRYIEPFCGSASLFFEMQPTSAVLSDINGDLIDALRAVQSSPDTVSECLSRLPVGERDYYRIRAQAPEDLSPNMRAARFIYLNLLCFNGLYRVNRLGHFNVPFGAKQRKVLVTSFDMRASSRALSSAEILRRDFEEAISEANSGDFIYLDPPYVTKSARVFNEYGVDTFSSRDLPRLRSALEAADKRGVKFVLSYADAPELRRLAKGWAKHRVTARRNIAGFVGSRKQVSEVLITNCEKQNE